jgi:hypothetical protein
MNVPSWSWTTSLMSRTYSGSIFTVGGRQGKYLMHFATSGDSLRFNI